MKYDVIIAGAGPSGCMAALAAARMGAKVLLIEKNAYPGGANTAAMVCPLMTFHSGSKQIVKGIAQEVIDRLAEKEATLGHIPDPLGVTSTITPIEPAVLRLVYFELFAQQPNITLLLHSFLCGAEVEAGNITRVTVAGKNTTTSYQAKTFIDATGDGDLAALCHVGFDKGRPSDGYTQPMSMIFKVGGIDFGKVISYMRQNPEQFICIRITNNWIDILLYLAFLISYGWPRPVETSISPGIVFCFSKGCTQAKHSSTPQGSSSYPAFPPTIRPLQRQRLPDRWRSF